MRKHLPKDICTHPDFIRSYGISVLSFFYLLKRKYRNSMIYNWNVNKLVKITGLSHHTCKKLSYHLLDKGLAYEHINDRGQVHLCLRSMFKIGFKITNQSEIGNTNRCEIGFKITNEKAKVYKKGYWNLDINNETKLNDIQKQLKICILKENLSRQAFSAKPSHTKNVHKKNGVVYHSDEFSLQHRDISTLINRMSATREESDNMGIWFQ